MVTIEDIKKADFNQLPVSKRVEAFYKKTDLISQYVQEELVPVIKNQIDLDDREKAIVGTYFRMCAWIYSMVAMNGPIHFQGAATAARSLFELLLDIKILADDNIGECVNKFHHFPEIARFNSAKKLVNFCNSHPSQSKINDFRQRNFLKGGKKEREIQKIIDKHWGKDSKGKQRKPNKLDHWTGMDARKRARSIGDHYESLYAQHYPRLSWYIHSGSAGYDNLNADDIEICFCLSHILAQDVFFEATTICAKEIKLIQALDDFYDEIKNIERAPGWIVLDELMKSLDNQGEPDGEA